MMKREMTVTVKRVEMFWRKTSLFYSDTSADGATDRLQNLLSPA